MTESLARQPAGGDGSYWLWVAACGAEAGRVRAVGLTPQAAAGPEQAAAAELACAYGVSLAIERTYAVTLQRALPGDASQPWVYHCGHPADQAEWPAATHDPRHAEQAARKHAAQHHPADRPEIRWADDPA